MSRGGHMLYRINETAEALREKVTSAITGDTGMIVIEVEYLDTPIPVNTERWTVRIRELSERGPHTRLGLATEDERYFRVYLDGAPLKFLIQPPLTP